MMLAISSRALGLWQLHPTIFPWMWVPGLLCVAWESFMYTLYYSSIGCNKHHDRKQSGEEERVYSAHSSFLKDSGREPGGRS